MSSGVVFAATSGTVAFAGQRIRVNAGEPWSADDALVKQYPHMFVDHVRAVRTTTDPRGYREYEPPAAEEPPVERATRAPGEKRATRRG